MTLRKKQRIRGAKNVSAVFSHTKPVHQGGLSVRVLRRDEAGAEAVFAVVVPMSAGKSAVKRNMMRRRVSERLRTVLRDTPLPKAVSVVLTVRRIMTREEIDAELVPLLKKSGILNR